MDFVSFITANRVSMNCRRAVLLALIISLVACGKSDDSGGNLDWIPNEFQPASTYANQCNTVAENFWLRSTFNDLYFWYQDIVDANPNNFSTAGYFYNLLTDEITPSGKLKDQFSFFADTSTFNNMLQSGVEIGYGVRWTYSELGFSGNITVGFVVPGSVADLNGIVRGDQLLSIDGISLAGSDRDTALQALFPSAVGESHTLTLTPLSGPNKVLALNSEAVTFPAVQNTQIINQGAIDIGYLQFNDHTTVSEGQLASAFETLVTANVDELILDMRYNSGGFLNVASRVAYMIAGDAPTIDKTFEQLQFNNKNPSINPVVGGPIVPTPFLTTRVNPNNNLTEALPTLNLNRVVIITDHLTCSASESIINGLNGIGITVDIIGKTTCGKPYGFYGLNNCDTTYLPVQFQGINEVGFGDYADGFKPANSPATYGLINGGCFVEDDFSQALGNSNEARLAAAVNFIDTGVCPAVTATSIASMRQLEQTRAGRFTPSLIQQAETRKINASLIKVQQGLNIRQ